MRGDVEPVLKHFNSGMSIAVSMLLNSSSRMAVESVQRIKEHVLPFFKLIKLQSIQLNDDSSQDNVIHYPEVAVDKFKSVHEARDSIVHLAKLVVRFIHDVKYGKYQRQIGPNNYKQRVGLLQRSDTWFARPDNLVLAETLLGKELSAAKVVRIHQIVSKLWLTSCTEPEECANDSLRFDFGIGVSFAEDIREQRTTANPCTFLFDVETVSPLCHIATRCRQPSVRCIAVEALTKFHR